MRNTLYDLSLATDPTETDCGCIRGVQQCEYHRQGLRTTYLGAAEVPEGYAGATVWVHLAEEPNGHIHAVHPWGYHTWADPETGLVSSPTVLSFIPAPTLDDLTGDFLGGDPLENGDDSADNPQGGYFLPDYPVCPYCGDEVLPEDFDGKICRYCAADQGAPAHATKEN